jgi:hypothetical protein
MWMCKVYEVKRRVGLSGSRIDSWGDDRFDTAIRLAKKMIDSTGSQSPIHIK